MKKLLKVGGTFIDPEKILYAHNQRIWFTADAPPLDVSLERYDQIIEALSEYQEQRDKQQRRRRR